MRNITITARGHDRVVCEGGTSMPITKESTIEEQLMRANGQTQAGTCQDRHKQESTKRTPHGQSTEDKLA
ncbi:hypothetical protein HaLaN_22796 [Haematococcus lacustris]|uniref:Uncharacterized protein n=1 Tax=Haematococcus lacustris TaxID=44745 RepID=A0A6A0A1D2_HAELA|nr:hypothetical protein HaLaN_22796 [Haematococcus lacustris]